jgi:hypothetical protein
MDKLTEYLQDDDKLARPFTLIAGTSIILAFLFTANAFIKDLITENSETYPKPCDISKSF